MKTNPSWGRTSPHRTRLFALGGVVGPAGFVGAWLTAGLRDGYDPVDTAISRLAAVGSDVRPLMTAGFVAFAIGVPVFAIALRQILAGPAWLAATVAGVATLGVAATPLDASSTVDRLHGVAATIGYLALAATPPLAATPLAAQGRRRAAALSWAAGVVSVVALAAMPLTDAANGLAQRIGLTVVDGWIVIAATAILSGRLSGREPVMMRPPSASLEDFPG